ncbi:protein kinase [Acinetobacter pittii]|nr:protein kinase [Acinetobacter pittii]HDG7209894.1 protein kinase [Acinetobacter nosocomialis]
MTKHDEQSIISELQKWALGHLGSKLTWAILEERFKFSRQSMQAKPLIKAAYDVAKKSLSTETVVSKETIDKSNEQKQIEIESLKTQIAMYKEREERWKRRWQQIAYHIRQKGVQMTDIDKPAPDDAKLPSHTETEKVLKELDKEIPFSGRI